MFEHRLTSEEVALIEKIKVLVRGKHQDDKDHDYSHVATVADYAIRIAQAIPEPVNPFLVIAAALLHDVGRIVEHTVIVHGLEGAALADEYLRSAGVALRERAIIRSSVARHTPTTPFPPATVVDQIVYDADALDRLGLIGLLRAFIDLQGSTAAILEQGIQKRLGQFDTLHFPVSRQIGQPKHEETLELVALIRGALWRRQQELATIPWPVPAGAIVRVPLPIFPDSIAGMPRPPEWESARPSFSFECVLTPGEVNLLEEIAHFTEVMHRDRKTYDYAHVLSVVNYALCIAGTLAEPVDPFVLICGALFHDIGRIGTLGSELHSLRGALIAREYLSLVGVSPARVDHITDVILRHTSLSGLSPTTVEEQIVADADCLAGLGLIGLLRRIIRGTGSTFTIMEDSSHAARQQIEQLCLVESQRLAEVLHAEMQIMIPYFEQALAARRDQV
ncbi:MAG: HD domain-containing protein, partial [Chloroflexota bacterium]|nr:HD domain-containing protein [Chloroflexota bacterium]